jgi:HEAT repeat protein
MGMLAGRGVAYDRIYPVLRSYAKNDSDAAVRQSAVEGMRFLGTDEALHQLYESFTNDPSGSVRERAGCNLSDCGLFTRKQRMHMVPKLIALVEDPETSPRMRNWSFMALHEITDENLLPSASAWNDWYRQRGAERVAQFEQQEWWRVPGDE